MGSIDGYVFTTAVHTVVSVANVSETNVSETMFRKHPNVYRALMGNKINTDI